MLCSATIRDAARTAVNGVLHNLARHRYGGFAPKHRPQASKPRSRTRLSATAEERVRHAIEHAWADSTLKKYGQGLAAFLRFCDTEGVDTEQRLPADEFLLCAFTASRAGEVAGVTARGAITAVKAWHITNDAEWQGGIRLRYTLHGVENLAPASSSHDLRPPVTANMLAALDKSLNHRHPKDAAVFAAACCAFWGQVRLGEILSETQRSFIPGRVPLVSDLAPPSTPAGSRIL
ncbi:hypothetical protein DFH09DRAFT_1314452 [Mycena vulgaris]|nr:hypothetical protein DFH09DRAFT_1314452 [Mycena vulgaris]